MIVQLNHYGLVITLTSLISRITMDTERVSLVQTNGSLIGNSSMSQYFTRKTEALG